MNKSDYERINAFVGEELIDLEHVLFHTRVTSYKTVIHTRETYGYFRKLLLVLCIEGRIILKWILKVQGDRV
jgi:hypothetical protein